MPTIRVTMDERTFIVDIDADNNPIRIKERKRYGTPPTDGWYNAPYWSAKHHKVGRNNTIVSRILKKAANA